MEGSKIKAELEGKVIFKVQMKIAFVIGKGKLKTKRQHRGEGL